MKVDPTNVRTLAQKADRANMRLRQYLKQQGALSLEQVDQRVGEITDQVWSTIDCTTCANCCKELRIGLTDAEARRLATRLGLDFAEFCRQFLQPTTDPDHTSDGDETPIRWHTRQKPCPFLKDNRCSVYEDRPGQCRKYPYLHAPGFTFRLYAMLERAETCPIVYRVLEELRAEVPFRRRRDF